MELSPRKSDDTLFSAVSVLWPSSMKHTQTTPSRCHAAGLARWFRMRVEVGGYHHVRFRQHSWIGGQICWGVVDVFHPGKSWLSRFFKSLNKCFSLSCSHCKWRSQVFYMNPPVSALSGVVVQGGLLYINVTTHTPAHRRQPVFLWPSLSFFV